MSRGQQARLKVVSAFAWPSQLVLMDEPLSSIDPLSRRRIIQALFEEYRAGEQTVLISTHLVSEVEEVVEDVVFLRLTVLFSLLFVGLGMLLFERFAEA